MDQPSSSPALPGADSRSWAGRIVERFHGGTAGWFVLAGSLIVTGLAWYLSNAYANRWATERFEFQAEEARLAIAKRMLEYEQVLRGGVGLFEAMGRVVTREEWREYVTRLEVNRHFPGLQGIGFAQWIPASRLAGHTEAIRAEGFADYVVRPEGQRDAYTSIVYLEPFAERNLRAFGYDMYSDPVRRAAMERARDTGLPAVSGRVTLVQETQRDMQYGFLMYLPVYRAGLPESSVTDRRAALLGFVYSPFRVGDLMRGILPHGTPAIDFTIYDGPEPHEGNQLYSTGLNFSTDTAHQPQFAMARSIEIAGRVWTVKFNSRPNFESAVRTSQPTMIAVCGVIIDLLLFAIIAALSSERRRVLVTATVMNREVLEGRELFRLVVEQAPNAIAIADGAGMVTLVNRRAETLFGYTRQELIGQPLVRLVPQLHQHQLAPDLAAQSGTASARSSECVGRRKDGVELAVEIELSRIETQEGWRLLVSISDVTERKRARVQLERALADKTTLLNEVHHRVKNNLQVISSLLSLQVSHTNNEAARVLIAESQSRVKAMALVHQLLYERQHFGVIRLGVYLQRLVALLVDLHAAGRREVDVRVDGVDTEIEIDPQRAIPCGLVVHELVTNALKHAFPAGRAGKVVVSLARTTSREVAVSVADDGVGMPNSFELQDATSLGFQLVPLLTEQLGATIERGPGPGARFELRFRLSHNEPSRKSLLDGEKTSDTMALSEQTA